MCCIPMHYSVHDHAHNLPIRMSQRQLVYVADSSSDIVRDVKRHYFQITKAI